MIARSFVCALLIASGAVLLLRSPSLAQGQGQSSLNGGGTSGAPVRSGDEIVGQLGDSIGQASALGSSSGGNVVNLPGFWHAVGGPGGPCLGDCDGNGQVTVDELVRGVNIALGVVALNQCPRFDDNGDALVSVDEIVRAILNALNGC